MYNDVILDKEIGMLFVAWIRIGISDEAENKSVEMGLLYHKYINGFIKLDFPS